jgi:hypothetical protein
MCRRDRRSSRATFGLVRRMFSLPEIRVLRPKTRAMAARALLARTYHPAHQSLSGYDNSRTPARAGITHVARERPPAADVSEETPGPPRNASRTKSAVSSATNSNRTHPQPSGAPLEARSNRNHSSHEQVCIACRSDSKSGCHNNLFRMGRG